jgi:hypothetical protein
MQREVELQVQRNKERVYRAKIRLKFNHNKKSATAFIKALRLLRVHPMLGISNNFEIDVVWK